MAMTVSPISASRLRCSCAKSDSKVVGGVGVDSGCTLETGDAGGEADGLATGTDELAIGIGGPAGPPKPTKPTTTAESSTAIAEMAHAIWARVNRGAASLDKGRPPAS